MRKIVLLDDYFPTGEQTIQPVLLWGPSGNRVDLSHVTKTASQALDYIKNVTPEPGKTHLLLLALGSEEAYGPNRNGDGFPERPVPARTKHASNDGRRWWVSPGEELTKHYQSFETNPAHAFKHHVNKDPKKASGQVKKAFWNDRMHRVELLVVIENHKDPEWVQRVNDGDFPPVSMGCRIKYDVCSICGNQAPTRAQYCEHVTRDPGMNQIMPDGKKAYVHNPSPNFFDISRVFRPADRTGYTLKKVAHAYELHSSAELGEVADDYDRKSAAIRKLSDIDKIVRGEPIASANLAPDEQSVIRRFKDYVGPRLAAAPALPMEDLLQHRTAEVLSTLSSMGMKLSSAEFLTFMVSQLAGQPVKLASDLVDRVIAHQATVFNLLSESPALLDEVLKTGVLDESAEHVNSSLRDKLAGYTTKRAQTGELLYRRLVPEGIGMRGYEAPRTDLLSYTDPSSGQQYETTRGAAIDARDAQTRADVRKMVGGGALLLGGYKLLSMHPALRNWKLPLALGTGALGYHMLRPQQRPQYPTDQGFAVPQMTEFAQHTKGASEENIAGVVVSLVEDYARLRGKTASYYGSDGAVQQLVLHAPTDNVRGVELDLDSAALAVGRVICS